MAVCSAVIANASTIRWGASGIKTVDGSANAGNTYLALCFISADSTSVANTISLTQAISKLESKTLTSNDYAASKTLVGGMLSMTTAQAYDGGWGAGDSVTAFLIIVDNTDLSKVENYLVANVAGTTPVEQEMSYTFGGASEGKQLAFGSQANNTGWTAVPEPTSGILVLLGMAGLALRRKRA